MGRYSCHDVAVHVDVELRIPPAHFHKSSRPMLHPIRDGSCILFVSACQYEYGGLGKLPWLIPVVSKCPRTTSNDVMNAYRCQWLVEPGLFFTFLLVWTGISSEKQVFVEARLLSTRHPSPRSVLLSNINIVDENQHGGTNQSGRGHDRLLRTSEPISAPSFTDQAQERLHELADHLSPRRCLGGLIMKFTERSTGVQK